VLRCGGATLRGDLALLREVSQSKESPQVSDSWGTLWR